LSKTCFCPVLCLLLDSDSIVAQAAEAYLLHLKKNIELRNKVGYVRFAVVCVSFYEFVSLCRVENLVLCSQCTIILPHSLDIMTLM